MQYVTRDRIQMGSSSTGTGNLTLNIPLNQKDLPFQNLFSLGANTSYNKIFYTISDGTNYEIGVGTFAAYSNGTTIFGTSSTPILSREEVLESTNDNSFVNFNSKTTVSLSLPANVTMGSVATGDDSSIGSNLIAWNNVQNELRKRMVRGTLFNNDGVGGIISTYSLVYTRTNAYRGGVLAPNGDIYFVPNSADRGQKMSSSGVVSTYSLVYTTTNAYYGGVLAPNGDIYFVSQDARVGQKVSAAGVVSTYSLVYTRTFAYGGGVLDMNGNIHFVPGNADRGQKISAGGVVSTYSLVLTTFAAYAGGVLAPNGDVHFVPSQANRGQKISSAGVVSTYALIYTTAGAYEGGILAPNGDIYFVPHLADRGQKISTGINTPIGHCVSPFFNKY